MNRDVILNSILKKFLENKKIILFGAGRRGRIVLSIIKKENIGAVDFFIDNKASNNSIDGISIYKSDKLLLLNKNDYKIIVCTDDINVYKEIKYDLLRIGYIENEDFISSKILRSELKSSKENPYEDYNMSSTYAPWLLDEQFLNTYKIIKKNTLVDIYRCYELWSLVEQASKLNEGMFLEIGVWRGGTGALIAKKIQLLGLNEEIYLCDTFEGVVKASEKDSTYTGGEHSDTNIEYVYKLINELDLSSVKILKGIFPDQTGSELKGKIRFCHIDVDVYKSSKEIIDFIWDKLEVNGIIVFDDFGFKTCTGISTLIMELKQDEDKIIFENLNGHAVIVKLY